jgi:hypothetical protein
MKIGKDYVNLCGEKSIFYGLNGFKTEILIIINLKTPTA